MSKVIRSPLQRWAGEVTISDPLTIPQAELIQDGFEPEEPDELKKARKAYNESLKNNGEESQETMSLKLDLLLLLEKNRKFHTVADRRQLPAIFACVEEWNLSNFPKNPTFENFPANPRGDSHRLIAWLFSEIEKVYFGESEVPNE